MSPIPTRNLLRGVTAAVVLGLASCLASAFADDIGTAATAAARAAPTVECSVLLARLDLQLRAAHDQDAIAAMAALAKASPPCEQVELSSVADGLIDTERDDLALRFLEIFPAARPGWGYTLLERQARARGWQTVDRWAAERASADPVWWLTGRLRMRSTFGVAQALADESARAARARPVDTAGFLAWMDATHLVNPRPDATWIAAAARPALAFDALQLGERLLRAQAPKAAVTLLERALAMPFTAADVTALREWMSRLATFHMPTDEGLEAVMRRSARYQLAEALLAAGDAASARKMLESLAAEAKTTGELPDLFLAGRIQAGSGARVVEQRILKEEEQESDTLDYWRRRAEYYRGRDEVERPREAFEKRLVLLDRELARTPWETPAEQRYFLVNERESVVHFLSGERAAFDMIYAEVVAMPATLDQTGFLLRRLAMDYARFLDADDAALWRILAQRRLWTHSEERLLWVLAESRKGAQRDALWTRAEALAAAGPPERASVLGWVMTRTDANARAMPLLRRAVAQIADRKLRATAAVTLFEASGATLDWRTAEEMWPLVREHLTEREVRVWAGQLALFAARAGAADEAIRLWAAKVDLDRSDLSCLPELDAAGLGKRLRTFYTELATRDPAAGSTARRALATLTQ